MGARPAATLVLDAGALIALERRDRHVVAMCRAAGEADQGLVVPAGVLAQVWRHGSRQVQIARTIRARETIVEPLDRGRAQSAGWLCGRAATKDVVDASVVVACREHHALVITSDRADLQLLDPTLRVIDC